MLRRHLKIAVPPVFLFSAAIVCLASSGTVSKDPQAIAVVQNALSAMGGTSGYQDSVATGTSTENGVSTPVVLKSKGTQLYRADYSNPNGTSSYVLNQGAGAVLNPSGSVHQLSTMNTFAERVTHLPVASLLAEYSNANVELTYSGTTQLNGTTVDVVVMDVLGNTTDPTAMAFYRANTQTVFAFDHTSGLPLKMQFFDFAENDTTQKDTIEIYFTNYQAVNGILIPFHQTTYDNGTLDADLVFTSVSLNVGLLDSDFALPQ